MQWDVFLPLPLTKRGPSYTCGMLSKEMATAEFNVTIVTPRTKSYSVHPASVVQTLPHWARHVPYKWVRNLAIEHFDTKFLSEVRKRRLSSRAAYIWPDVKLQTIRELQLDGIPTFREMINCHRGTAKALLDDAYARIGVEPRHTITEASVQREQEVLETVDYIFCPNKTVEDSLIQHGISDAKIIPTSYGWEPSRFLGVRKTLNPTSEGLTLVFVGSICVRKGCHLLLEYWASSGVKGRLVLAGEMEPTIREKFSDLIERDNVVVLDFVSDVGALYRSADAFVFPSLEEGAPLVTYEACGCELPIITTPMGAARIVRHGQEGYVIDAYNREEWIAAIQSLARDRDLRARMGAAAARRARDFCWRSVAGQRKQEVLRRMIATAEIRDAAVSEARKSSR